MQETLDVYLWLLSNRDDVKEMLGFLPKKIIVTGDSAGGTFSLVLPIVLNELNKKLGVNKQNQYHIPLPKAIVLTYACLNLKTISPSRCLSVTLEALVALQPIMIVMCLLATNLASNNDFEKIKNSELYKKIEQSNQHLFTDEPYSLNTNEKSKNPKKPFFSCDYPTFKIRCEYIDSYFRGNSFIAPFSYEHFDELSSIDLYSLVGDLDFLMDDSIEISNRFQGNVSLDILKDVIHGYYHFGKASRTCKEAINFTIRRFQEACDLI